MMTMRKTMLVRLTVAAVALIAPTVSAAQVAAPPTASAAIDPARLDAARKLMDDIMSPLTRGSMLNTLLESTMTAMSQSMQQNADFNRTIASNPKTLAAFTRFLGRQRDLASQDFSANMPAMVEAMAHAYARRFTMNQLHDLSVFFATPTGQAYLVQSPTVMGDPDVAQWVAGMMGHMQARMPAELDKLMADLDAASRQGSGHDN